MLTCFFLASYKAGCLPVKIQTDKTNNVTIDLNDVKTKSERGTGETRRLPTLLVHYTLQALPLALDFLRIW